MNFATITLLAISLASYLKPSLCADEQTNINFCMDNKTVTVQTSSGGDDSCKCSTGESMDLYSRPDYTYVPGVGTYKLHTEATNWDEARKICQQENAYLAVINSDTEEEVLLKMLRSNTNLKNNNRNENLGYLGIHDLFEEGDWVTVYGESIRSTGYQGWSRSWYGGQPDDTGHNSNCAVLIAEGGGMDDVRCGSKYAFFCELTSICEGFHISN